MSPKMGDLHLAILVLGSEGRQLLHWDPQKPRAVRPGSMWQLSPGGWDGHGTMGCEFYPLVNSHITMENHNF